MSGATTRYAMIKPTVGGDADVWGGYLNQNMDDLDTLNGAITTAGTSTAYTLTTGLSLAAYVTGQRFLIMPHTANGSSATINVDGLGTRNLRNVANSASVASGELLATNYYLITYNGTGFVVNTAFSTIFQPLDATVTAFAGLTTADDRMLDFTGTDTMAVVTYATVLANLAASGGANFAGSVGFTDSSFSAGVSGGIASIAFDALDGFSYTRSTNSLTFAIGLATQFTLTTTALTMVPDTVLAAVAPTSTLSAGFRGAGAANAKTADYTTAATDEGNAIDMNSGSAHAITIKASTHRANAELFGVNKGAGTLTITRDAGVTFRDGTGTNADLTVTQYGFWYARRDPSTDNLWYVRVS